jgi:hypothetical protein
MHKEIKWSSLWGQTACHVAGALSGFGLNVGIEIFTLFCSRTTRYQYCSNYILKVASPTTLSPHTHRSSASSIGCASYWTIRCASQPRASPSVSSTLGMAP